MGPNSIQSRVNLHPNQQATFKEPSASESTEFFKSGIFKGGFFNTCPTLGDCFEEVDKDFSVYQPEKHKIANAATEYGVKPVLKTFETISFFIDKLRNK